MTDRDAQPRVRYDHTKALRSAIQALDDVPGPEARGTAPATAAAPPRGRRSQLKPLFRHTLKPLLQPVRAFFSASILGTLTDTNQRIDRITAQIETLSRGFATQSSELARMQSALASGVGVLRARADFLVNRNAYALHDEMLIRTPYGYVLVPLEDSALVVHLVEGGGEPGTNRVLAQRLRPGDVYVDVGANVGTLLLNGARRVGPTGRAFAFEPTPRIYDLLCANVALNGIAETCECSNVAVGRAESLAKMHVPSIYSHASLYELPDAAGVQSFDVQVLPLDDLIPADVHPTLIKIDVEGAELDVIAGMARILGDDPPPTLIVEYGSEHLDRVGVQPEAWFRVFTDLGYQPSIIDEQDGSCRRVDEMLIEEIPDCNVLFEPRPAAASPNSS